MLGIVAWICCMRTKNKYASNGLVYVHLYQHSEKSGKQFFFETNCNLEKCKKKYTKKCVITNFNLEKFNFDWH